MVNIEQEEPPMTEETKTRKTAKQPTELTITDKNMITEFNKLARKLGIKKGEESELLNQILSGVLSQSELIEKGMNIEQIISKGIETTVKLKNRETTKKTSNDCVERIKAAIAELKSKKVPVTKTNVSKHTSLGSIGWIKVCEYAEQNPKEFTK